MRTTLTVVVLLSLTALAGAVAAGGAVIEIKEDGECEASLVAVCGSGTSRGAIAVTGFGPERGDASSGTVAIAGTGNATGTAASASGIGNSTGGAAAVAGLGDADGDLAATGVGEANGTLGAASGAGNATSGGASASGVGDATGTAAAVAGVGEASGEVAGAGAGDATGRTMAATGIGDARSAGVAVAGLGDSKGLVAVVGSGVADGGSCGPTSPYGVPAAENVCVGAAFAMFGQASARPGNQCESSPICGGQTHASAAVSVTGEATAYTLAATYSGTATGGLVRIEVCRGFVPAGIIRNVACLQL